MLSNVHSRLRCPRGLIALGVVCLVFGSSTNLMGQVKVARQNKSKVHRAIPDASYTGATSSAPVPKGTQLLGPGNLITGFEPAEGFAPGFIDLQAGWTAFVGTTQGTVSTLNPALGTQHLRIELDVAVGAGSFTGGFSPDLGMLPSGASTTSVDVSISASGGADYLVAAQSPSEGFLTWEVRFSWLGNILILDDIDGFGFADVDTGVAWTPGAYVTLTVCDDPIAGTTDYFYGGALIYSQVTHVSGTRVEQIVLLSDNFQAGDTGDFDNLDLSSGLGAVCTAGSTCGNNVLEPGEACDGTSDAACPGACLADCTCPPPVCGNGIAESGEACDGADDALCPGLCLADCTCGAPPPPANDDCANSLTITDGTTAIDTTSATTDGPQHVGHPACDVFGNNQLSEDVWFTYFATCTGDLTLTMCEELGGGANFDTRIAAYAPGCPASDASLIDCNDDDLVNPCGGSAGGFHSTLALTVTTGQEILVRVGGFSDSGTGLLNVVCAAPPVCGNNITEAGEQCDGTDDAACPGLCSGCQCPCGDFTATAACSAPPLLLSGSTIGAADDCGQRTSEEEIWEVTVTETGLYNFNMATNAPFGDPCAWDSYIYLMDGCCSGNVVASNDDCAGIGCFGNSCIDSAPLVPGVYYLVVEGFGSADAGDYVVTVDCAAAPICGDNVADPGEACDGTDDAACPGLCQADCTCPAPVCGNNVVEVGEVCDGTSDAACPGLCQADCSCGVAPPPVNDFCANSTEIFVGTTPFDTTTATTDGPAHPGHPSCDSFGFDQLSEDIWYHHFATCTGDLTVTTCEELGGSALFDTRIAVYNPGCPATDAGLIDCNDDDPVNACGLDFHSTVAVPVTTGQEVLIRVGGFGASGTGVVNITCAGAPPVSVCGNNILEAGEQCDGTDSAACPGVCQADCTCPGSSIPAVSEWGLVILTLLGLMIGTRIFAVRRTARS